MYLPVLHGCGTGNSPKEQSMKNMLTMTVILFILAASLVSRAQAGDVSTFVGLWEAVDPLDGSHLVLSITKNEDDTVKLLIYDTFFTTCDGNRGTGQGTGEVSAEGALKVDDFTISCFETGNIQTAFTTFTRNSDGTLREVLSAPLTPLIIYHRTNK